MLTARWSEATARSWASRDARVLEDPSLVDELASLRYRDLFTSCGTEIRFHRLPRLEDRALAWRARAGSLFRHIGVKNLFSSRLDAGGVCRSFRDMTGLRALAPNNVRLASLDGIEDGPALAFLEIGLARKLSRLDGLEAQTG